MNVVQLDCHLERLLRILSSTGTMFEVRQIVDVPLGVVIRYLQTLLLRVPSLLISAISSI